MLHDEHIDVKVTIVTVVYNAVDKIEPTLLSVFGQTYDDVEYIVVDGGSTDGTLDVINRHRERISVVVSERDEGIYDALNKGVKLATGEWVGIMNAGDVFAADDVLERVFSSEDLHDGFDVIYGDSISVDGDKERLLCVGESVDALRNGPYYRHGSSFVRRTTHLRNLFDLSKKPLLGFALDYEQIYRMYKGGCRFKKVNVPVVRYELRGASTVSPFKVTYYNYLISHDMKCSSIMKLVLVWLMLWRGGIAVLRRHLWWRSHVCR